MNRDRPHISSDTRDFKEHERQNKTDAPLLNGAPACLLSISVVRLVYPRAPASSTAFSNRPDQVPADLLSAAASNETSDSVNPLFKKPFPSPSRRPQRPDQGRCPAGEALSRETRQNPQAVFSAAPQVFRSTLPWRAAQDDPVTGKRRDIQTLTRGAGSISRADHRSVIRKIRAISRERPAPRWFPTPAGATRFPPAWASRWPRRGESPTARPSRCRISRLPRAPFPRTGRWRIPR